MASKYINNWIQFVDSSVIYWLRRVNNQFQYKDFLQDKKILSVQLARCSKNQLSHLYFPEVYYGSADDSITKLAVVLFYNPGRADQLQKFDDSSIESFRNKFKKNKKKYSVLASKLDFAGRTKDQFFEPQKRRLKKILLACGVDKEADPFFIDLIPWHSAKFNLNWIKFNCPVVISEAIENMLIPAVLIAKNSHLSQVGGNFRNHIVLFCVGAKYSNPSAADLGENILSAMGFKDLTQSIELINNIPENRSKLIYRPHLPRTILTSKRTVCHDGLSYLKVWSINFLELISHIDSEKRQSIEDSLPDKNCDLNVVVINIWNNSQNMNIPDNIGVVVNEILKQI